MDLFSHLTKEETELRKAIQSAYAADAAYEAVMAFHKVSRWDTCAFSDVLSAKKAYQDAAAVMNQAFVDCRASGSIYPIVG